ncbi:MAG: PP2C family protein-serine/threonine phosphatase [Prevotella sp.]|nr:PP2C family protein-serine/threonine phosphatase [Prevotella sp.]
MQSTHADSVIFDAGAVKDYARMMQLVDSFELKGEISSMDANRWRGVAYYRQGQYRSSEFYYKKVLACEIHNDQDLLCYVKAARRLSELLLVKRDYEGSLQVALPAVAKMRETGFGSDIDFAILLNNIGCCQLNLGRGEEAQESFYTARQHYINRWTTDTTSRGFQEAVIGTVYTSQAYTNTHRFGESLYWIDRTEMLLGKYREMPDARLEYFDEYQARIEIMRAVALQGLDSVEKASQAYQRFLQTAFAKTNAGRVHATDYLLAARRYKEAADNFRFLDQMLLDAGVDMTLDNIQLYLLPKVRANVGALRRDSVVELSMELCNALDSAIIQNKNDDTAELATIYDTQHKEAMIAQQQADLTKQRFTTTAVALGLLLLFLLIYTIHRRKSMRRLAAAHEKLKIAYDRLEETTAQKERIESELRIARDIQMSMVPSTFPDYPGLDIYGSMTPAKEVGGDLYGYVLVEDKLYLCIGDVSGKGVPASLFMSQTTRLFHTLAATLMMPSEIATRMNAALSENNEQGMFVTMFIGLINLKSGRMDYCNCGHNPPVAGAGKDVYLLTMEPNAPIGLWPDLEFVGEHVDDIRNCPFFFYTDGLSEAENTEHQQFGEAYMMELLSNGNFGSAKRVVEFMKEKVEAYRNGAEPNDDLTMLCLKLDK